MLGSETPETGGDFAPDGSDGAGARTGSGMSAAGGGFGRAVARLVGYGALTIGVTLLLLRPGGSRTPSSERPERPSGPNGSMFLGSGPLAVLFRSMTGGGASTSAPEVAAADPGSPGGVLAPETPATNPTKADPEPPVLATQPEEPAAPQTVAAPVPVPQEPSPAQETQPAPAVAKPTYTANATPKAVQGKAPQGVTRVRPAAKSKPAVKNRLVAARPASKSAPSKAPAKHASARQPRPKAGAVQVQLGPQYLDDVNGYAMQFPAGWSYRKFTGGSWILDATDGQAGLISVGFSRFPEHLTADKLDAARIARGIRGRPGTVIHGGGIGVIAGRRCVWHKYTGPVARPGGSRARMTVVQYLLPLQDGRALDVRAAAAPGQFSELAPSMRQSLQTLRLLAPQAAAAR